MKDLPFQVLVVRFELMLVVLTLFYLGGWPEEHTVYVFDVRSHEDTTTTFVVTSTRSAAGLKEAPVYHSVDEVDEYADRPIIPPCTGGAPWFFNGAHLDVAF